MSDLPSVAIGAHGGSRWRLRAGAAARWLAVPWSEWALAGALVVAFATPVLLVGSADVWRAAAEDDLAQRSVADASLARNGIDVAVESRFSPDAVASADAELTATLAAIAPLDAAERTSYTLPGPLTIGPPPLRRVGPAGRLVGRAGAVEAVDVVSQLDDTSDGVWISTWFADRLGVELGDTVAFDAGSIDDDAWNDLVQDGGVGAGFRVVGLYEPLWSADEELVLDEYWSSVPAVLLPTFVDTFNEPNFELVLTDEETLLDSGLTGVVRWTAPLESTPTSYDELRQLRDEVRRLERGLVETGALATSMKELASAEQRRPTLTTEIFSTTASVESAVRQLIAPLRSARALGAVVGLSAVFAVGAFLVERRRREFRLLASEGERWPIMSTRVACQLALPAIVGGAAGATAAVVGAKWFGPAVSYDWAALPWDVMAVAIVASVSLAALTAGVLGARSLRARHRETERAVRRALVVVLVVATVIAWAQVGRTTAAGQSSLDLVVVALPVLAIMVTVLVLVALLGWTARFAGRHSERLPVEGFIAARRLAGESLAVRLVGGSLGLGVGLLVFAVAITTTLDRMVDVKLATSVGGVSSARLIDELPADLPPPAPTTVIRSSDTRLTPGAAAARIVAIDPETYADAVTWSDQFGPGVDEVLAELAGPIDDSIPVVAIEGENVPREGAFGLTRAYPYRVVATVRGFPTAGDRRISVLASADAITDFAARQNGDQEAPSPVDSFRSTAVSQASASALTDWLSASDVRYRDVVSREDVRESASIVAPRSAFAYLAVIGVTAAAAAAVAMALFLSARRRSSALAGVLTRSMGLPAWRAATISAIEIGAVLLAAVGAGLIAGPVVVERLAPRFDPAPDQPPTVSVVVDWAPLVVGAVAGVMIVSAMVWLSEYAASRRPAGSVVRDAG
jgi:hypothetical protein